MEVLDGILEPLCEKSEDVTLVVKSLNSWGCCPRCVLRFLGEKQLFVYQKDTEELQAWVEYRCTQTHMQSSSEGGQGDETLSAPIGDPAVPQALGDNRPPSGTPVSVNGTAGESATLEVAPAVCVTCLGVLQDKFCSKDFQAELKQLVDTQDYEFTSYLCSLLLPVTTILREHGVYVKLKELLPAVYTPATEDEVTPIKDIWKWYNGATLSALLGVPFDQHSGFEVCLNFVHAGVERECAFLVDAFPDMFRKRKANRFDMFTRANVHKALGEMSEQRFRRLYTCPPRPAQAPCDCRPITCTHEAIHVAGRYNKYSRHLSQTPWVLADGERKSESSIEEYICDVLRPAFRPTDSRFSASGREDVDVVMLGRGRPFVVELLDPHRIRKSAEEMRALQDAINGSTTDIAVRDLQLVSKEETGRLKEGEIEKIKHYSARCWLRDPLSQAVLDTKLRQVTNLVVKQKTPIRVLHRRNLAVRDRLIHSISAKVQDRHHVTVSMATQAGTYVKEFVHGDFGRTTPNLGILLNTECDILELDVENVELDWPKALTP